MTTKVGVLFSFLHVFGSNGQQNDVDFCNFAPLCGTQNQTIVLGNDIGGNFPIDSGDNLLISGAELTFESCCSLEDTKPTRDCEIVNPSSASERYITISEEICASDANDCEFGECEDYALIINPFFIPNGEQDCCDTCKCYGDPQCEAFDGTEAMWILCDGREVPGVNDTHKYCRITEEKCEQQRDHAGNKCQYLAKSSQGWDWSVIEKGSPCVPNANSPPSIITMYEVPDLDFSLRVAQGERGVIKEVLLSLQSGDFTLDAEDCLIHGESAWNQDTEYNSDLPAIFKYTKVVEEEDILWNIIDPATGIAINIRCYGNHYAGSEANRPDYRVWAPRMNVESVSDPIRGRSRQQETNGFCVSGNLDYGRATTANTEYIESGQLCVDGLNNFTSLETYRAICKNPALPQTGIPHCVYSFCSQYFVPLFDSVEECIQTMNDDVAEGFCKGVTFNENDMDECVDQWYEFGPESTITQYYNDYVGCVTYEELKTSPEQCESGTTLQYEDTDGSWVDVVFIPVNYCGDKELVFTKCEFNELFTRPLRFVQNTADVSCGVQNQCVSVEGFKAFIGLTGPPTPQPTTNPTGSPSNSPTNQPTSTPTESPTKTPTQSPTLFPTNSPTESPTKKPTAYPTTFPTNSPSVSPTLFPTNSPTSFPTTSPSISPTNFPTLAPSTSPTVSPTSSPTTSPTESPTEKPTASPTKSPTTSPTVFPTSSPTTSPTVSPTKEPTSSPTTKPSSSPTNSPTYSPSFSPTLRPTGFPLEANFPPTPSCEYRLCGTPDLYVPLEQTGDHSYEFNSDMDACCPIPPEEACPGSPEIEVFNRSQGTKTSFCGDQFNFTMNEECESTSTLTVEVNFERNEDVECCQTCSCFGDPSCSSFDGTFGEFVVCDGRAIPRDSNGNPLPQDRCVIRKDECEAQRDHEGNQCVWKNSHINTPNYTDPLQQSNAEVNFPIIRFGSPCQYDKTKSAPSKLLLYKIDDLEISVEQYDRGLLYQVMITTANGDYSLNVNDCLSGKGWTKAITGVDEDYFDSKHFNGEYIWNFVDATTHVELNMVCTGVFNEGVITDVKFINIENINEPDQSRANSGDGFCATSNFPERSDATYQKSDYIHENDLCYNYNENKTHIMLRESVRAFTGNPTLSTLSTERGVYEFCSRLWRPQYGNQEECVDQFMAASNVENVIAAFCRSVSMSNDDEAFCNAELAENFQQNGYEEMFTYAREKYITNGNDVCTVTLSDLPDKLSGGNQDYLSKGCKNGVELQYYQTESNEWITFKAFPGDFSPCNGFKLQVDYAQAEELFIYPIRILQEYAPKQCTACNAIASVESRFEFNS